MSQRDLTPHLIEFKTALENFRTDIDKDEFPEYIAWLEQREKTIGCVNSAIEELNKFHSRACLFKAVSSTTGTLAEAGRIIGAAASLHPVGRAVKSVSDVVMFASSGVNLCTVGVEHLLSRKLLEQVKEELRNDEKLLKKIANDMTRSRPIHEALRKILGLSILPSPGDVFALIGLLASTIFVGFENYASVVSVIMATSAFNNLGRIVQTKFLRVVQNVGRSEESLNVMRNINCTVQARPKPVGLLKLFFRNFKDYYFEATLACFMGGGAAVCAEILDSGGSLKSRLFDAAFLVMLALNAIENWKAYQNNEPSKYAAALIELRDLMMKEVSSVNMFLLEAQ